MTGLHLEGAMALAKLIGDQDVFGFTFNDIATANDGGENMREADSARRGVSCDTAGV